MKLFLAIWSLLAFFTPDSAQNMTRSGNGDPNDEPYTILTTYAGRRCVEVPEGKFLYFRIDKSSVPSTMDTLLFKVTYLDEGQGEMRLQYNATGGRNYESAVANRSGSGQWITATLAVSDASLRNAQNHGDIRINSGNHIARIEVWNGTMNPLTEPAITHLGGSSYSSMRGKSVAGYQAWFRVGGQRDFWHHWGNDAIAPDGTRWPRPYNHTFEIYPDLSLYEEEDLYPTGFAALGNGDEARLYDGQSPRVIAAHFDKMQEVGLQGVAVQRFLGPEMRSLAANPADKLLTIQHEAERTGRIFYICYDITSNGLENTWADLIRFDWVYNIEKNLQLTQSAAYATMEGRPVVEIWGTGFTDNHPGNAAETIALIDWLKARGCYVIGGVPTYWRENRNDAKGPSQSDPRNQESFEQVYLHYNMLSPWLVGRFSNTQEAQYFYQQQALDMQYCQQHNIDYMPVLFAGFGWATWNSGQLNQAPRLAGDFLKDQATHARQNGCQNLYFAMFDEYDEGTALLSAATDASMIPSDAYFLTTSADGRWLSADYYLRLAAAISAGTGTQYDVPYSLGPVYYRNSFEQRTTQYNWQNNAYQSQGTFPVDPCLYQASPACSLVCHDARTGGWALRVNGAIGVHKIATMQTVITSALRLTGYTRNSNAALTITLSNGQTITGSTATAEVNGWHQISLQVPATMIGQTITELGAMIYSAAAGQDVYMDDILLETSADATSLSEVEATAEVEKFLQNGQIYIRKNGQVYNMLGNAVH